MIFNIVIAIILTVTFAGILAEAFAANKSNRR